MCGVIIFTAVILGLLWWAIRDGDKYNADF